LVFPGTAWRVAYPPPDESLVAEPETPLDAERILRALAEHEVDYILIGGLAVQHMVMCGRQTTTIWQFVTRDGGVDVMHEVPGGRSYEELSQGALHVQLGTIDVPVVGLDDLIQMKLARGRPVDLADVASLTDPDANP
jgi:hypothetical protein